MFDFGKFIAWTRDGLFEPATSWQTYKEAGHSWKTTAMQLSVPLLVASGVLTLILSWMFSGSYVFGRPSFFGAFIFSLLMGLVWFFLGSFLASFLAGKFGGKDDFDQAWSALTFAAIPGLVGSVLGTLPWIGWLLSFAAGIWTLVLLWQALPVFLDVPLEKRVGHFFATLGLSIVGLLITGTVLGTMGFYSSGYGSNNDWSYEREERISNGQVSIEERIQDRYNDGAGNKGGSANSRTERPTGGPTGGNEDSMFGFGREIDYMEAANNDRYTPPGDGKITEQQLDLTMRYLAAAERLRDASKENLERLGDNNDEPSLSDLFKGVKGLMTAGTAEMQAVKSGGGNWAEHEWVKKQLFEARLHQDLNDTTEHNWELYQEHEEQLQSWL